MTDQEPLVPWEAFDPSHPDHAEWVAQTRLCLADHDHDLWLSTGQSTDEEDEDTP